jgi:hypothetical protein
MNSDYIWIDTDGFPHGLTIKPDNSDINNYVAIWGEGSKLYTQWLDLHYPSDGFVGGVLADWLDEHREEIMAITPKCKDYLNLCITFLRKRYRTSTTVVVSK